MNNAIFGKAMVNLSKHGDKTCPDWKKKKLFNIWTKLSYYKVFHRKFITNRNEKSADIYKLACLFKCLNTLIK